MKGPRILLVDDEVVFTTNMSKLLANRGYDVVAVNSGDAAVEAVEKEKFDVVILDLKMPGMDGITTLEEIKRLSFFTEILILTGHGSMDSAFRAIEMGAYDYVMKPCEIAELVIKMEGAYARKRVQEKKA
jgi:DNA-binding NtrC family response regulator